METSDRRERRMSGRKLDWDTVALLDGRQLDKRTLAVLTAELKIL